MTSNFITTPDGVRLHYTQDGPSSGPNVVFIPGWVQTAAQFKKQVAHFKQKFHVTTYDHRGHGESDKPAYGYRVSRLAADLEFLLKELDLRDVALVGHSMGSSVIWAHWDLFAHDRIKKVAFVDQAPSITADPAWTPEQAAEAGSVFPAGQRFELANALRGPEWRAAREGLTRSFFSPDLAAEDLAWTLGQQMKAPREVAAAMMLDHGAADWRDVIPRIDVPALVVAARGSLFPVASLEWVGRQIKGARVVTFEKEEGGFHFMFWENPDKFNRVLEEFLLE
ncbi:alpha/beta-hydrolase [Hypoxylon rubiginosum]|uniref:Alpha/beta-hydrolase n=1 Tax=Hypoxylon rubiginosum TaxID=110542 RepID=A0ACB9YWQ3_9PEZI|nr:alpha/beta-hydrolase [Hypoxylon rubiginosum]